ncbi:addiction module antidote protein [uncultured Tateyamaria sp.]|uniref:addiction module antidote protein n=1 Tax=uncultured Tateyamaria sp. TaxID=455651 RepID=UPI002601F396|nr:addiction module antidote protein [uncultured Tateyamaria sp.]
MVTKTTPYDTADYLDTPEVIEAYLEEAFASGDSVLIAVALGNVARAQGMSKIATETGLSRESLYRALSEKGNPELGTVLKVLGAIGVTLSPKYATVQTQPH